VTTFSGPLALDGTVSLEALRCPVRGCDIELRHAHRYLLETARPGGTMTRQGPELAIERLHPEFAKRLAIAIRQARDAGLTEAGVFSAYRPPAFGVGGFSDKYDSLHAYGLAVDMYGIGRPGSDEAQQWHYIAAANGIVCPYGYQNRLEWNHCQPTHLEAVREQNPLRDTITGTGPVNLELMFHNANPFIAAVESTRVNVVANRLIDSFRKNHPPHKSQSNQIQRARASLPRVKSARKARIAGKPPAVRTRVASLVKGPELVKLLKKASLPVGKASIPLATLNPHSTAKAR
jgi:hypothetical protein